MNKIIRKSNFQDDHTLQNNYKMIKVQSLKTVILTYLL